MLQTLPFELALLEPMALRVRAAVLTEIGLSEDAAEILRQQTTFRVPHDLNSGLAEYERWLGAPVRSFPSDLPGYREKVAYAFFLNLWPHLWWVVYAEEGRTAGAGFRNQARPNALTFDTSLVRPGVWGLEELRQLADRWRIIDGWDEKVSVRFEFGTRAFEGNFVLDLLQDWRAVE